MRDLLRRFCGDVLNGNRLDNSAGFGLSQNRFGRFLLAGGVNTVFGFIVYSICILAGLAVWIALLVSTLVGTVFNFFTTGSYVFRQLSPAGFFRFVVCYLFIYGVNYVLIELVFGWVGSKILSQAILVFPLALLSYFLMARFVFPSTSNKQNN